MKQNSGLRQMRIKKMKINYECPYCKNDLILDPGDIKKISKKEKQKMKLEDLKFAKKCEEDNPVLTSFFGLIKKKKYCEWTQKTTTNAIITRHKYRIGIITCPVCDEKSYITKER